MRDRLLALYDTVVVVIAWAVFLLAISMLLSGDIYVAADTTSGRVQQHIRTIEFDFLDWTLAAIGTKVAHSSLDGQAYLDPATRSEVVRQFFDLRRELEGVERAIAQQYADPAVADPEAATADLREQEGSLRTRLRNAQALAEAILQEQLSVVLAEQGLALGGQPVPPVSFQMTPLPYALIVSPRDVIRQDANLDVNGDLTLAEQVALEEEIAAELDVSTLIVPLGGIGTYPTMVAQSSDLNWITSVVAHEWLHNYLTLRPLGMNYMASPELRTMNETTAELIGEELGALLIERYYPERMAPERPFGNLLRREESAAAEAAANGGQAPAFDFRAEMHTTRVTVDALLAQGRIAEAEAYMEARRAYLWKHGYQIRKLNQAYFAFYGAYAAGPGGAAGRDPVGGAVRLLRRRSASIAEFVNTMAGFTSFAQLEAHLDVR